MARSSKKTDQPSNGDNAKNTINEDDTTMEKQLSTNQDVAKAARSQKQNMNDQTTTRNQSNQEERLSELEEQLSIKKKELEAAKARTRTRIKTLKQRIYKRQKRHFITSMKNSNMPIHK